MPRLTTGAASPSRARQGVTLVELMVAMFLLALIGAALTKVLVKQQQYYKDMSRSASARRELRLGATVLPAELRSISTAGGDILEMSEQQITMRAAIGSSIICAKNAATSTIYIPPTNLAKNTLTSFVADPVQGDTAFLFDEGNLRGSEDDTWQKLAIAAAPALSSTACPGAPYTDPVMDPPVVKKRRFYQLSGPINDSVKVGAVVRFTRPVRYLISARESGSYLAFQEFRNGAWQAVDLIAGPYRPFVSGDNAPSGLQFRFYDTLGVRLTNYADSATKTWVGRVDVFLRTNGGTAALTERNGADLRDSIIMRVGIRNSK